MRDRDKRNSRNCGPGGHREGDKINNCTGRGGVTGSQGGRERLVAVFTSSAPHYWLHINEQMLLQNIHNFASFGARFDFIGHC